MAWLFLKLHALVIAAVWGLAGLLGRSVGRFLLAVWLLLNEEVRRYTGLAVWGVAIVLAGKGTLNYAPPDTKEPLLLIVLALLGIWALAVRRAVHLTRHNNLIRVQQRQAFKELRGEVGQVRSWLENLRDDLGRRARGTPLEGMWQSNRDDRDREQAEAEAAAAQAEADRRAREERDRELVHLGAEHDPFERQGG